MGFRMTEWWSKRRLRLCLLVFMIAVLAFCTIFPILRYPKRAASCQSHDTASLATCLLNQQLELQHLTSNGLLQNVQVTQLRGVWALSLHSVYADSNRILVVLVLDGPGFHIPSLGIVRLSDMAGRDYTPITLYQSSDDRRIAGAYVFDARSLPGSPAQQDFLLNIDATSVPLRYRHPLIPAAAGRSTIGPWGMRFSLAPLAGRTIAIGQTAIPTGSTSQPITLDRIVITPSEVRAYVRFAFAPTYSSLTDQNWYLNATLIGSQAVQPQHSTYQANLGDGTRIIGFARTSPTLPENYQLTIAEATRAEGATPRREIITGPWSFPFVVPPEESTR